MYEKILVPLDASATDRVIIEHIKQLARQMQSAITLLHVVDNATAKWNGEDAGGQTVEQNRAYLETVRAELFDAGITATCELAFGDPVKQIVKCVTENNFDLVAMSTHGHHFIADFWLGTTANRVQHRVRVPVLLLKAR